MLSSARSRWLAAALVALSAAQARATWSILIVDTETKEIAVGSATCLTQFDLNQNLPMVLVDIGAACAQSAVDGGAVNRTRIRERMLAGDSPDEIIAYLSTVDSGHESRQYGIVDTLGRAASFTGSQAGAHASGVIGQVGQMVYAIQGNVLTGAPVVLEAEAAVINTPGDLPAKLMAGMEAARFYGGDGRCSCTVLAPTICGAPPSSFEKSAHIGFMFDTRFGDVDGVCNSSLGCANGDYFMDFNVPFQNVGDPDPVLQLQAMFDLWRDDLVEKPDAVQTTASFERPWVRADGVDSTTLVVQVRDWRQEPIPTFTLVSPEHAAESAGRTVVIGEEDLGNGLHRVDIGQATEPGLDRFNIRIDSFYEPVTLLPFPELLVAAMHDIDADGETDLADHAALAGCLDGPDADVTPFCGDSDIDRNLHVDLADFALLQSGYTNELCERLDVVAQPQRLNLCSGDAGTLTVGIDADPDPEVQWYRDGVAIPGAVGPAFTLDPASPADEGYYHVRLSSTCGTVESDAVQVRVFDGAPCP